MIAVPRAPEPRATHPTSGRDLLRKERFGALYYQRSLAEFIPLGPAEARLLLAATERPVAEVLVGDPGRFGLEEDELVRLLASWEVRGLLDEDGRCPALCLEGDRAHGALTGPLVTNLQLTRACNLSCGYCFVEVDRQPHPDELSTDQVLSLFRELADLGSPIVVLSGGEPTLRRDFWAIAEGLEGSGLDAALCTNASSLSPVRAERLARTAIRWYSVSLDGPDAETHDRVRGPGSFARALEGVKNLVSAGAKDVKLRVTVTRGNADRLGQISGLARELGVHTVSVKPFRHTAAHLGTRPTDLYIDRERYQAAIDACRTSWPDDAPPLRLDDGMPSGLPAWTRVVPRFGCVGGTTHASVSYDGRVVACDAVHAAEDWTLHQHSFGESWRRSPTLVAWRELEGNEACSGCAEAISCRGGCRARALGLGGSLNDPDPWAPCP